MVQTVRQGWAVVFFPEGTFGREPGLRPFHMGAFVVAAQAGVPVVPLALVARARSCGPSSGCRAAVSSA